MSGVTDLTAVANQIQTIWSPLFMQELRESFILPNIVSRQYEGEIKKQNDTVRISQINAPSSDLRTVGVDADTFETNVLSTSYIDLKADKRAVSAFEIYDLVDIQSIVDPQRNPEIRKALMQDIGNQINDYLYTLLVPSTSSPDHTINSQATLTSTLMANMREAVSTAKWPRQEEWYSLVGPGYYADLLADTTMNNFDYGFDDKAMVAGFAAQKRFGFNIIEDNSKSVSTSLHSLVPSALLYAAQTEVRFQVSPLHAQKKFGYLISADLVFGAKLSISGSTKCYTITSAA